MLLKSSAAIVAAISISATIFSCTETTTTPAKPADSNLAKNKTQIDTQVIVKDTVPAKFVWKEPTYDSTKQYIYLTFDDGPQPGTLKTLEICKKLGVKATFFMVGEHARDKWGQDIVSQIREEYPAYLLANHSYTHASNRYKYFYQHPDYAKADFLKAQQSLNVPYKIIRLPGNSAWVREGELKSSPLTKAVSKRLDTLGFNIIGWDQEWEFNHKDARPIQSAERMAGEIVYAMKGGHSHKKNHVVLLSHDRMFRGAGDADSLIKMITLLKQHKNYIFETIDNYPGLKTPQAETVSAGTSMK